MNKDIYSFHHIGIAVNEITATLPFYSGIGYKSMEPMLDPEQDVYVSVLTSLNGNMPRIELLAPASDKSPILTALHKNGGVLRTISAIRRKAWKIP